MFATMKIVGVTPDAIGKLHNALSQPECRTNERVWLSRYESGKSQGQFEFVTIEESKLDSQFKTYTVTLKINLNFLVTSEQRSADEYLIYQPIGVLRSILQAIDPNLLPDKETRVPTPETARKLRKAELSSKLKELETGLEEKMASLVDKSTKTLLKTADGRIILPSGEKVERHQHHWNLLNWDLMKLDLPDVDDVFIKTLREAQGTSREIDRLRAEKDLL